MRFYSFRFLTCLTCRRNKQKTKYRKHRTRPAPFASPVNSPVQPSYLRARLDLNFRMTSVVRKKLYDGSVKGKIGRWRRQGRQVRWVRRKLNLYGNWENTARDNILNPPNKEKNSRITEFIKKIQNSRICQLQ